jgi:hypothetical protein
MTDKLAAAVQSILHDPDSAEATRLNELAERGECEVAMRDDQGRPIAWRFTDADVPTRSKKDTEHE